MKKFQQFLNTPFFILALLFLSSSLLNAQEVVSNHVKATQSSTKGRSVASRAVDGNKKANNHTISRTHVEDNPWLELDLGRDFEVSKIKVWHLSNSELDFYIKQTPEQEFEKIKGLRSTGGGGGKALFGLRIPKRKRKIGRYVRVVYPASKVSLEITEVQVFGDPVADGISTSEELMASIEQKNESIKKSKKEVKKARRNEVLKGLGNTVAQSTGKALEEGVKQKVYDHFDDKTAAAVAPSLLSSSVLPRTCADKTHAWKFDWSDVKGATEYEIVVSLYANSNILNQAKVTSSEHTFPINSMKNNLDLANSVYWKVRSLVKGEWSAWGRSTRSIEPCEVKEEALATFESGIDEGSTFVSPSANQEMANVCDGGFTSWQFEWKPVPGAEMYKLSLEGVTIDRISYETNQTFKAIQVPNQSAANIINPKAYIAVMINGQWSSSIGSVPFKVEPCNLKPSPPKLVGPPRTKIIDCEKSRIKWNFDIQPIPGATKYFAELSSSNGSMTRWSGHEPEAKLEISRIYLESESGLELYIAALVDGVKTKYTSYSLKIERCNSKAKKSASSNNSNSSSQIMEVERKIQRDYTIEVKTADKTGAGTDSNIYLTLHFANGKSSDEFRLNGFKSGNIFERNNLDIIRAHTKSWSGAIKSITVRSDGKHAGSAWDLAYIKIGYLRFICNCEINKGSKVLRRVFN